MNFLPLCTAIVCPIISGTMVERRDQVFTTFFSLRVFSASTFSRKWPSTNGPFFSERAIANLFLHAAQTTPLRSAHLLKSPHRTRNAVRLRAKRANKPGALCVRNPSHNHCPARLAQLAQHRIWRSHRGFHLRRGLGARLACCSLWGRPLGGPSGPLCGSARRPPAGGTSGSGSCGAHGFCSHQAALPSPPGLVYC